MAPLTKILSIALAVCIAVLLLFFGLWRYESKSHSVTKDRLETAIQTISVHEKNTEISERASNEYQANIDRLNADIKRLRARPAKCITFTPSSGVYNEKGQRAGHGSEDGESVGIRSDWLYDYAIEAEKIRIERNGCKDFVNKVWDSRK